MTINLNNALVIGTMSNSVNAEGKHTFTRWCESHSMNHFLSFCQYIIDGCPDSSSFVIVDVESQNVLSFDGFVFKILGLKSKRYPRIAE